MIATIGAGGGVYGQVTLNNIPVTVASTVYSVSQIGDIICTDTSAGIHYANGFLLNGGACYLKTVSGVNLILGALTDTLPFTWAVGDLMKITGRFLMD